MEPETLTVIKLIRLLSEYPEDALVQCTYDCGYGTTDIYGIKEVITFQETNKKLLILQGD